MSRLEKKVCRATRYEVPGDNAVRERRPIHSIFDLAPRLHRGCPKYCLPRLSVDDPILVGRERRNRKGRLVVDQGPPGLRLDQKIRVTIIIEVAGLDDGLLGRPAESEIDIVPSLCGRR